MKLTNLPTKLTGVSKVMQMIRTLLLLLLITPLLTAQEKSEMSKIWSKIELETGQKPEIISFTEYVPAPQIIRKVQMKGIEATVLPNVRPFPTTNSTQSEMSIDVHPNNSNIIFMGANTTSWTGSSAGTLYGTGTYWSTDGGVSFGGFDDPQGKYIRNSGDPAAAISFDGIMYMGYIDGSPNQYGQGVARTTDIGTTWAWNSAGIRPGTTSNILDKNHLMVDKLPTSPYAGRVYNSWTAFVSGDPNNNNLEVVYSSDNGATWSSKTNISAAISAGSHNQGVNLQTGPNGQVYAMWAVYDNWGVGVYGEDAMALNISTNGGQTWGTPKRIYSAANFGIRGNIKTTSIRVSSFPSMAVDRTGGPGNGNIYGVWPQKGVAPAGNDPDIVLVRSTDGGNTFSTPVRVNDDPLNNGRDQYYPWMTVDQSTGFLYVLFYDSRDMSNDSATVYLARSTDFGVTFENIKISDSKFRPAPISGLAGGYQGDYIGIAAKDNRVYAYWSDNRTGAYQGWLGVATFGPTMSHNPLKNTENLAGPYTVNAQVEAAGGLLAGGVKLFWGRGTNGEITDSVVMNNSGGNTFTGDIPGNSQAATYNYYIKATDNTNGTSFLPAGAPSAKYSFVAATDVTAPVIVHTNLGDQFRETWPKAVEALVTDNIGVDSAWVTYKVNTSGTLRHFKLLDVGDGMYAALFNLTANEVAVGDTLYYRITAKDQAAAGNLGYHPSQSGWVAFRFINDPELPVITHTVLGDQPKVRWPAKVRATVTDNLGISSVLVEYKHNNGSVMSFNLTNTTINNYEGNFNLDTSMVAVGDSVEYRIKATDNSNVQNVSYAPLTGYYKFKITATKGLVLVIDDDVTVLGRQESEKGYNLSEGDNPLGASASLFSSTLQDEGYVVTNTTFAAFDTTALLENNVVVLSSGVRTSAMFDNLAKRTAITNWSRAGGKTIVEGGEVGYVYRFSAPSTDKDPFFRQNVLFNNTWVSDVTATNANYIIKKLPSHGLFTNPYAVSDSLIVTGTGFGPRDAVTTIPVAGIFKAAAWTGFRDSAGIIMYSPTANPEEIRNMFMTFSIANMTNQNMAKAIITNALEVLMDGGGVIPVELSLFTASVSANNVTLNWSTATELNNQGFFVERKQGNESWESLGFIRGQGTTIVPMSYSYTDRELPAGSYSYRLKQMDFDGTVSYSDEVLVNVELPTVFALEQNYPNPFNPSTVIKYSIPVDSRVELSIFNVLGEKVATLVNDLQKAGSYEINFDASKLSSGVYLYKIEAGSFVSVKKMILAK